MNLDEIRRLIIIAVCSDDFLLDTLVLKGGNALSLIHGVGQRSSVDIDFSIESDFDNLEDARLRLFRAIRNGSIPKDSWSLMKTFALNRVRPSTRSGVVIWWNSS